MKEEMPYEKKEGYCKMKDKLKELGVKNPVEKAETYKKLMKHITLSYTQLLSNISVTSQDTPEPMRTENELLGLVGCSLIHLCSQQTMGQLNVAEDDLESAIADLHNGLHDALIKGLAEAVTQRRQSTERRKNVH